MNRQSLLFQVLITFVLGFAWWYEGAQGSTFAIPLSSALVAFVGSLYFQKSTSKGMDRLNYSFGAAFSIAIFVNYGIMPAMVFQPLAHFAGELLMKKPFRKGFFNFTQFMLSSFCGGFTYRMLGGACGAFSYPLHIFPLIASAFAFLLTNVVLVLFYLTFHRQTTFSQTLRSMDYFVIYNGVASIYIGIVYALTVASYGVGGFVAFALLLVLLSLMLQLGVTSLMERKRRESVEQELLLDAKTQVYNYKFLNRWLADRDETPVALLFLDLDDFKLYNDTFGHEAGDAVLVKVASLLKDTVSSTDSVVRYGGEEFVVILPDLNTEEAHKKSEELREKLVQDEGIPITASFGVAAYPEGAKDRRELIHRADYSMYKAKAQGKNQSYVWRTEEEISEEE